MSLLKDVNYKIYKVQYIPLGQDKFIDVEFPNYLLPYSKRFWENSLENDSLMKNYYKTGGDFGYSNKKIAYHVFRRISKYNPTLKIRILKIELNQKYEEIIKT